MVEGRFPASSANSTRGLYYLVLQGRLCSRATLPYSSNVRKLLLTLLCFILIKACTQRCSHLSVASIGCRPRSRTWYPWLMRPRWFVYPCHSPAIILARSVSWRSILRVVRLGLEPSAYTQLAAALLIPPVDLAVYPSQAYRTLLKRRLLPWCPRTESDCHSLPYQGSILPMYYRG